jgi:hypothetical protein
MSKPHEFHQSNAGVICTLCWRLKKDCMSPTCDGKKLVWGHR